MFKKTTVVMLLLGILAVAAYAESLRDKAKRLEEQRRALELQMHSLRVDLIKQDSDLNLLYQKILAMHKELQLRIDNKPAMKKLAQQAADLELEIKDLEKQIKDKK